MAMAPRHAWLVIFAFLVRSTFTVTNGQQCAPLKGTFRQQCAVTGYNQTFPIPYKMDPNFSEVIGEFIDETIKEMENCSVGAVGETIICSVIYAPHCIEGQSEPQLPCRRVCSEYIYRCLESDKTADLSSLWTSYLYGLCTLLPNETASTGDCYEPPAFESHFNSSSSDLLQGNCHPNIFPWCQDTNYEYTVLPTYIQKKIYKAFYDKNFTGDSVQDAQFSNKSWIHRYDRWLKRFPKCSKMLKMMFCADRIPPCFPGETSTLYTICQPVCQSILLTCPELKDTYLMWYLEQCQLIAYGNSSHGYCKHTKWPNPHDWLLQEEHFGIKPTTPPPKSSVGPGVIVAAVLVPIIVIVLFVFGVFLWRNRKLPWRYFGLKADDRRELVT